MLLVPHKLRLLAFVCLKFGCHKNIDEAAEEAEIIISKMIEELTDPVSGANTCIPAIFLNKCLDQLDAIESSGNTDGELPAVSIKLPS